MTTIPTSLDSGAARPPQVRIGMRGWLAAYGGAAPLIALTGLLLLVRDPFLLNILIYTYLFAGLAVAWNIIAGFGGQFSLGHGVFFAVGAYTTAILYMRLGVPPWFGMLAGAALCAVVGPLIFWPTFRLKGSFFAIATLAFNEVALVLTNFFDGVTGGPQGLQVPFRPALGNMIFDDPGAYALLMFCFMTVCIVVAVWVRNSRLGYYLLAVREDEDSARATGIDVARVKLTGTALSAALAAIGGALFAMYVRTIDPPMLFSLPDIGVKFALVTLIGGIGTLAGPVLGALLIIPLESWLRATLGGTWPGLHLVVLGVIMLGGALFMKRGVMALIEHAWLRRRQRKVQR